MTQGKALVAEMPGSLAEAAARAVVRAPRRVPYAGPLVLGVTITLFALVTGGVLKALAAAIYFVVYGQLEGNVLAPFHLLSYRLYGSSARE